MRDRVGRLRIGLLSGALVLILVLAAFIGWARYLRRQFLAGLPGRLGVNIVQEASGFEYCQLDGPRKVYCIKASKAIKHTSKKIALHDVSITLYGKKADRSDRIYGDEFEYDQNAQVMRATGAVHIDLQPAHPAGQGGEGGSKTRVIHLTTSGLVFLQKFGVAATSGAIEFAAGGMTGHAVGADYSSDSGMLTLHSAVTMSGIAGGRAVAMTAATAQFDQHSEQALMTHATYESEGRRASANEATIYRRTDGTLSRIEAKGDVRVGAKGSTVTSDRADIALSADSQPQTAVLSGAVRYAFEASKRQVHGEAAEATIAFDREARPQPEHAVFSGSVHMTERTRAGGAGAWSVRDLTSAKVEAWLVRNGAAGAQVRDVEATGSSRVRIVDNGTASGGKDGSVTELGADNLKAHLINTGNAKKPASVDTIVGRGHTLLRQVTADGREQTVSADAMDAKLRAAATNAPAPIASKTGAAVNGAGDKLANQLWSSVLQGHVALVQRLPAKPDANGAGRGQAGPTVEHALAERAVYDGDTDRMTLSDGVQVSDAQSVVWAKQIVFDHKTGDEHAAGGVKVSYGGDAKPSVKSRLGGAAPGEATHVVADRADVIRASGVTTFYGKPVRLWQGGSQVKAEVIELTNGERRLVARGTSGGPGTQVLTVLAGSGKTASGPLSDRTPDRGCQDAAAVKKGGVPQADAQGGVTRIASGGLAYSGGTGEAHFTGGFRAETEEGTIRGSEAIAYMKQGSGGAAGLAGIDEGDRVASAPGAGAAVLAGNLDRVVTIGPVELDKPGLKATGSRLVYTASDGTAVLTGDARTPPTASGPEGTTTGEALRLRIGCGGGGSVEVVGGAGHRVHTDASISDRDKEHGK